MTELKREGRAQWTGDLKSGRGATSTGSGALRDLAYSFSSRFESGKGTNPEELIASAHASCFSMMLAKLLRERGALPRQISTKATVFMRVDTSGVKIHKIHLATEATADEVDATGFQQAAEEAKERCPVSLLLKPGLESMTLEANLKQPQEAGRSMARSA